MNIYDIAEKSGYSIATISRVLNGGKNVSQKTYNKVREIIEAEGYTPNVFARGLGLDTMKTVGILVTDVADPVYAQMVSHLTNLLAKLGYDIILRCTGYDVERQKRELQLVLDKRVDAVFLAGSALQELRGNAHIIEAAKQTPIIIINGNVRAPGVFCVEPNLKAAVHQCVLSLAAAGYRKPVFLIDFKTYSGQNKLSGYKLGLKELGYEKSDIKRRIAEVSGNFQKIILDVEGLLDSNLEFDSIIAAIDPIAIAAQKALRHKNVTMPVIGINNSEFAEMTTPSLTSIDIMVGPVCGMAVQLFDDITQGKDVTSRIIIDCNLVERRTFKTADRE